MMVGNDSVSGHCKLASNTRPPWAAPVRVARDDLRTHASTAHHLRCDRHPWYRREDDALQGEQAGFALGPSGKEALIGIATDPALTSSTVLVTHRPTAVANDEKIGPQLASRSTNGIPLQPKSPPNRWSTAPQEGVDVPAGCHAQVRAARRVCA
jgi:hypothetical protein